MEMLGVVGNPPVPWWDSDGFLILILIWLDALGLLQHFHTSFSAVALAKNFKKAYHYHDKLIFCTLIRSHSNFRQDWGCGSDHWVRWTVAFVITFCQGCFNVTWFCFCQPINNMYKIKQFFLYLKYRCNSHCPLTLQLLWSFNSKSIHPTSR